MSGKIQGHKYGSYKILTQNKEQAKIVLTLMFKNDTAENINLNLFYWIEQHPESHEINRLPDLFPEKDLKDLLIIDLLS